MCPTIVVIAYIASGGYPSTVLLTALLLLSEILYTKGLFHSSTDFVKVTSGFCSAITLLALYISFYISVYPSGYIQVPPDCPLSNLLEAAQVILFSYILVCFVSFKMKIAVHYISPGGTCYSKKLLGPGSMIVDSVGQNRTCMLLASILIHFNHLPCIFLQRSPESHQFLCYSVLKDGLQL